MKTGTTFSRLALLILSVTSGLNGQTGSASGTAGGSRVDFSFPAQLSAGKYAPITLPDGLSPVGLTSDGTVILRDFSNGREVIGYRWKSGQLTPLSLPDDFRQGGYLRFPISFQITRNGWVMVSFSRIPGPPSTVTLLWPPGETIPVRLPAPQLPVEGFEPAELVLEPVVNSAGKVWAKVVYPLPDEEREVRFVVWDSIFNDPRVLDKHGWAVRIAGVNASGTLIGTYTPDEEDGSGARGFVGDFQNAVDFEPRLINDAGWVVGLRSDPSVQNVLWKDGSELLLPDGEIDEIDQFNNLHGRTPEGRHAMWTTDLKSRVSTPGATYRRIDYILPSLPEGWASELEVIPADPGPRLGSASYRDPADSGAQAQEKNVLLVPAELAADTGRDGKITLAMEGSSDAISSGNPFRFWVNDDDDSGDTGGTDIPDGSGAKANFRDQVVNGTRDLIDFFPVFLDLKPLLTLLPPDGAITYKLKQADGALNFAYSNLSRERALAYQKELLTTGFGDQYVQGPGMAATHPITAEGTALSSVFLEGAKDNDWGVILVEGRAPTTAPLVLSVERLGTTITEVKLELRISDVEAMFRHIDLTRVPTTYDGSPVIPPEAVPATRTADPGEPWPDRLTNGKYFVFLHGYNVDGQWARGWQSEVFKRLHVLGSKARFVGVTWNGATGVKISDDYLDYHQAVFNAFQTGDVLAGALGFTNGADVTVAAHSLGNMVASHAIQRGGFAPARYFMINAATPVEAYSPGDVSVAEREDMVEHDWKSYGTRLTAANWYSLFGPSDHRSELTWENRFQRVRTEMETHDFFSPGDDVVSNGVGVDSASVSALLLRQGPDFSTGVWKAQELVKGVNWTTSGVALLMERGQAGWGFNPAWYQVRGQTNSGLISSRRFPSEAGESAVPTDSLKTHPFFLPFLESELFNFNAATASAKATEKKVQYDVLARGVPSRSYAVATRKIISFDQTSRNFNMESLGRFENRWPAEGHTRDGTQGRWLHSDFKAVAFPYVYRMFEEMIIRGALK
jgi:hypothetical protein